MAIEDKKNFALQNFCAQSEPEGSDSGEKNVAQQFARLYDEVHKRIVGNDDVILESKPFSLPKKRSCIPKRNSYTLQ